MENITIPERKDISESDKWDLSSLFSNDIEWEKYLDELKRKIPMIKDYKGTLGISAGHMAKALDFILTELGLLEERLGYYVMLRQSENVADQKVSRLNSLYMNAAAALASESSWLDPEIMSLDESLILEYLSDSRLKDYRIYLKKLLRFKPYTLSEKEEIIIAKQMESAGTPQKTFSALTNADMSFGSVETPRGVVPVTQSTFSSLMLEKDREVRENAYKIFYGEFDKHKNTLAELYSGSVLRDKYLAEIRGYPSARAKALFPDNVPEKVYDNLIKTVKNNLPALHDYYRLRAGKLNLKDGLRHWDVYVSIVDAADMNHTWQEAVNTVCSALEPLGREYVSVLRKGLEGRWADRYENKGKRSGAFSAGSYSGEPYILMNYKENVLRDVFTMAHEGGHSMHSWYSVRNNPFPHYSYTIFEAEVASTFNEQLLAYKLLKETDDPEIKAYLTGKQIDDIIATIYRQTMFAEFERDIHDMAENGKPVTLSIIRETYRKLLEEYFGPEMIFEEESDLESLRIPHFYRAFYVYKYATGLSAAMALAEKVINGGAADRESYLNFLKSGGSQFPIDSLKLAGVDMSSPEPVNIALKKFAESVNKLQSLI